MKQFFKENYKIIIICLSVLVVAGVGSIFVNLGMDWYAGLTKPTEWIPNFVIYFSFLNFLILGKLKSYSSS